LMKMISTPPVEFTLTIHAVEIIFQTKNVIEADVKILNSRFSTEKNFSENNKGIKAPISIQPGNPIHGRARRIPDSRGNKNCGTKLYFFAFNKVNT
jgi:hypothetical protein